MVRTTDPCSTNLNEYLGIIHRLENEMTNDDYKRRYWVELYETIKKQNLDVLRPGIALALINPQFPDIALDKRTGFIKSLADYCELGKLVSGAICPNTAKHKDHIWPYSLGGATIDANRADLCERCNRGKGATIVGYFPWERATPNWVLNRIDITRRLIGI